MNKAQIKNSVISIIPSHLIMMIAMTSLTLLIFYKSFGDGSLVDSTPNNWRSYFRCTKTYSTITNCL